MANAASLLAVDCLLAVDLAVARQGWTADRLPDASIVFVHLIEINGDDRRFRLLVHSNEVQMDALQMIRRQSRMGRRVLGTGVWRWLVLLLVLGFAASGLLNVSSDHRVLAASHVHDLASASEVASGDNPCCHEDKGKSHGTSCGTAAGCSICGPIASAAVLVQSRAVPAEMEPTGIHSGRIQPPRLRPPEHSASA